VVSNDCITDTMRYSVRHAGLLFSIGFESNGNRSNVPKSWRLSSCTEPSSFLIHEFREKIPTCIYWQAKHSQQEVWSKCLRVVVESYLLISLISCELSGFSIECMLGTIKCFWRSRVNVCEWPDTFSQQTDMISAWLG